MKTKELKRILTSKGFVFARMGKHEIWQKGSKSIPVPTHKEVNAMLVKRILKQMDECETI